MPQRSRGFNRACLIVTALMWGLMFSVTGAGADTARTPYVYDAFTSHGCGFTIGIAFPVQNQFETTSTRPDGTTVNEITGYLEATFTNVSSGGPTVTENVSGSTQIITKTQPDGSQVSIYTYSGPTFLAFSSGLATKLGVPAVFVLNGQAVLTVPSNGPPSSISYTGTIIDMCTFLA